MTQVKMTVFHAGERSYERAVELSRDKYCSVAASLNADIGYEAVLE